MNHIHKNQVNRIIIVLRPKSPFLTWISSVEPDIALTLDELRDEQDAMLLSLSDIETIQGAKNWAYHNWEMLFDKSLFDWYTDEKYWPESRDLALFKDWFDIEWHPVVWDLSRGSLQTVTNSHCPDRI